MKTFEVVWCTPQQLENKLNLKILEGMEPRHIVPSPTGEVFIIVFERTSDNKNNDK